MMKVLRSNTHKHTCSLTCLSHIHPICLPDATHPPLLDTLFLPKVCKGCYFLLHVYLTFFEMKLKGGMGYAWGESFYLCNNSVIYARLREKESDLPKTTQWPPNDWTDVGTHFFVAQGQYSNFYISCHQTHDCFVPKKWSQFLLQQTIPSSCHIISQ